MNDNSIEEVYYKPHNSPLDFKDESCFSAEISKIEHIPKYREKKENDRRGLVNYQESSERIVQENNTQNGYKQFVDTFGSYNRQSRKNWNSKSPRDAKLRFNMNPVIHSYLSKVRSEKIDYSYETFTNTENYSDESFKVTIKVDKVKIKQMSMDLEKRLIQTTRNNCNIQEIMSSTNETQGKDQNAVRLNNMSPDQNRPDSNINGSSDPEAFINGRFLIKKYQDLNSNCINKRQLYSQYSPKINNKDYAVFYENQDSENYENKVQNNTPMPIRNILEKRETELNIVQNLEQVLKNQQNLTLSSQSNHGHNKKYNKCSNNEEELSKSDDSYFNKSVENGKQVP